jgi:glycogen synthase
MNYLFRITGIGPLAKVGGLADVVGSLPKARVQWGMTCGVDAPV